ncbi:MAG TPA: multicopper oxidase domain-containing protein [Dongiaceae bacterium]|nr:multicopper oxidase domain-containing protein [Dongiaceae bacterium]
MAMNRREFLKMSATGIATIVVGSHFPFLGVKNAYAATQILEVTITDALKDMVTHNSVNTAQCYFWVYKMRADGVDIPVECPGPSIYAIQGDTITISITNTLDEAHSFFIPGVFDSGPIAPGATVGPLSFTVSKSGAHLYYDNLNEPVNRVMGLHGALVVRPAAAVAGHNFTPYDNPPPHIQNIFDDLGNPAVWPGLKWEEGDPATNTPSFRQYVWVYHQPSPNLFAAVGNAAPGTGMRIPANFVKAITRDPFSPTRANNRPQYFTVNGQSGFFSHFDPAITPVSRVGEPVVIHILNAGVQTVSHHMHCNHFFITMTNRVTDPNPLPNPNPIWVDVYGVKPMDRVDYVFPFMRPPDLPNARGIGRPDQPLQTINGHPVWPPVEEMQTFIPALGTKALAADGVTPVELGQRLSPLCYPAHDHLETSQTAQGGNYNMGLITGAYVFGDRNAKGQGLGDFMNFPMDADFAQMFRNIRGLAGPDLVNKTGLAAGPRTSAG